MKLLTLSIRNFKGVREFIFEPNGNGAAILGENATCKTSIADAFSWLLTDKDLRGQADCEIKPLDSSGEPIHGLESSVEAVLDVDGQELTLKKTYSEKFTKRRGSAEAVFSGHDIGYWIDGVPSKKSEFVASVEQIAPGKLFSLLTSPTFFSEKVHWSERRKLLLEICGDITDADVIASNGKLSPLPEILGKRSLDDHRRVLAGRRTEINKQLADIPVRISETQRGIVAQDADPERIKLKLAPAVTEKNALELQLVTIESGGEIAEKTKQLWEVEGKLIALANEQAQGANAPLLKRTQVISRLKAEIETNRNRVSSVGMTIDLNVEKFKGYQVKIEGLRADWHFFNNKAFDTESATCPTCGQAMPEGKLKDAREAFNLNKSKRLEEISKEGQMYKTFSERATGENEKLIKEREVLGTAIAFAQAAVDSFQAEIEELKNKPVANRPEYEALQVQKAALESEISELQIGSRDSAGEVKAKIAEVAAEIEALRAILAQIEHNKKATARIAELAAEERTLAAEYERLEGELFLCELFIKTKVSLLTEKINSHFEFTRFVLFEEQINGGLTETCRVMVNGIPYENLNNAMRIQSGMDVIRTLQKHYGVSAPLWIDNRESIIELPKMDCQVISLIVSEAHKTLTVEMENKNEREAA